MTTSIKPSTSEQIMELTKHYGSPAMLQEKIRELWLEPRTNERILRKIEAVHILYDKMVAERS